MKPLATFAALAFTISAFAQTSTVIPSKGSETQGTAQGSVQTPAKASTQIKIKSKGDDIRTVIDSIFEQAGKQYVLETNFHQSLYMNLEGVTFDKAIEIIGNVAGLEFEEKLGIWYLRTRIAPVAKPAIKPIVRPVTKTAAKAPVKKGSAKKPLTTKKDTMAGQPFATISDPELPITAPKVTNTVDLTGKLTVQLKKMDIREVFGEFGRQTMIEIEIDETVPNYKLDAYFYNTSLKFALDKVCKIAGLKYSFTPSKTLRISKA